MSALPDQHSPQATEPYGLYVHVPFCAHRCGYCDFVTVTAHPELHDRYVAALSRELSTRADAPSESHRFSTIFIGGGTPTLLGQAALEQLLGWCNERAASDAELTIECNPETVTPLLARTLVESGVTRVSLGAQSFTGHVLETLERRATPDTVRAAVATLREAGVANLSLDLIWGVPGQQPADVRADLAEVARLEPDHVSAYELEFKPGTRLTRQFGGNAEAVGEASDEHYDLVVDTLGSAGYEWYETANFARAGRYCLHNIGYWTQRDYIGVGVGAVGTSQLNRRTNLPNIVRYMTALEGGTEAGNAAGGGASEPPARVERLDALTRRQERIMLALRMARPLQLTDRDLDELIDHEWLTRMHDGELLVLDGQTIELTRRGRMLLNSVLGHLLR